MTNAHYARVHPRLTTLANSIELFTLTSVLAQSGPYFILLLTSSLADAGRYSYYVAIAGVVGLLLRPQVWMYLGTGSLAEGYKAQIYKDTLLQKLAVLLALPVTLLAFKADDPTAVLITAIFAASFNCNYIHAEVRHSSRYIVLSGLNLASLISKFLLTFLWQNPGASLAVPFLATDAALWSLAITVLTPWRELYRHRGNRISRPWVKNYFWGWLHGIAELPMNSADRVIVGTLSTELLGLFALLKQINTLFGLLNVHFSNKLFDSAVRGSRFTHSNYKPKLQAISAAALLAIPLSFVLLTGIISSLAGAAQKYGIEIAIFIVWCTITVGYYHIHIAMNLRGLTRQAFLIHAAANIIYVILLGVATSNAEPLPILILAVIGQQAIVITGKLTCLSDSSGRVNTDGIDQTST